LTTPPRLINADPLNVGYIQWNPWKLQAEHSNIRLNMANNSMKSLVIFTEIIRNIRWNKW